MKKITMGEKIENKKYDFRETCFGIVYVVKIDKEINKPTEKNSTLKIIDLEEANKLLQLPYHKRAIKEYKEIMNNTKFKF